VWGGWLDQGDPAREMTHPLMLPMLAAGAVALGFGGRCFWRNGVDDRAVVAVAEDRPERSPPSAPSGTRTVSHAHSTETLASLLAVTDGTLYGRLALWLLDAGEADLAAYWKSYSHLDPRDPAIVRLVFIQWTRLNPRAAITAVAGTADEATAWWAWACHDPAVALAGAIADNPARVADVAKGIGEFHPAWLRTHFDEIPAAERNMAMGAMKQWGDDTSPLETLEFFRQHGSPFSPDALAALIRRDPWAAYDWVRENVVTGRFSGTDKMVELLVKTLAEEHPDELRRLAKQAPSGGLKLQLETAAFDLLLKSDPAAALAEAKANQVPRVAAQRLAAVGNSLVKTDPEQAFTIARELFAANPNALAQRDRTFYGKGLSESSGYSIPGLSELLNGLVDWDPARAMALHTLFEKKPGSLVDNSGFEMLAKKWADRDLPAFGDWLNEQSDPAVLDCGGSVVIDQLLFKKQFAPAVEWAAGMQDARVTHLYRVISGWQSTDPAAAGKWLDDADLTEADKTHLRKAIRNKP
jgi:hypothetical protein